MLLKTLEIRSIEITGNKIIDKENIDFELNSKQLLQGRILDPLKLDSFIKKIRQSYILAGYYKVNILKDVSNLNQNLVDIKISITEGDPSKVESIKIIGAEAYNESFLLKLIPINTGSVFNFITKGNLYSKEKLNNGLQKISSFYFNEGFIDFNIKDITVELSTESNGVNITIIVNEGKQYQIGNVLLSIDKTSDSSIDIKSAVSIKTGDLYKQKNIAKNINNIKTIYANNGYALVKINPITKKNTNTEKVDIDFKINPNKKIYVNRINIIGNNRTQDNVIRQYILQLEGSLYSEELIKKSEKKLRRLGYFSSVKTSISNVIDSSDKVDLNFYIEDVKTGKINFGLSHSSNYGLSFEAGIKERNFLGIGYTVSTNVVKSKSRDKFNIFVTNPIFNIDNHSISGGVFYERTKAEKIGAAKYNIDSIGLELGYGVPLSDDTKINSSLRFSKYNLKCGKDFDDTITTTPATGSIATKTIITKGKEDCEVLDNKTELLFSMDWEKNTLDRFYFPNSGYVVSLGASIAIPGGNYRYYEIDSNYKRYIPINKNLVFRGSVRTAIANGYSGNKLPFFKRYYIGGSNSVRGFDLNSLGPKYTDGTVKGGKLLVNGNLSLVSMVPFVQDSSNMRIAGFLDVGNVFSSVSNFKIKEMRASLGLAFIWVTQLGPLGLFYAEPLNKKSSDDTKKFQFTINANF